MIVVDFSQVSIGAITADAYKSPNSDIDVSYARHLIINTIRNIYFRNKLEYGTEMVLACDAQNYWRKEFFQYYKSNRKKMKEDSKLDWEAIGKCLDVVREELKLYFPYPVIYVNRAEGDDVIGTLAEWTATNDLTVDGMWEGEPKPLLVVSSDGDQIQTQQFPHVRQWGPLQKKYLTTEGQTIEEFIREHIAEGDRTDGIVNVLSESNCIVDGIRQKSLMKDRREEFIKLGIDACRTDKERENYLRNQTLVDFRFIPQDVKDNIIQEFLEQREVCKKRGRMKLMTYFVKNRMSLMLDHLSEF